MSTGYLNYVTLAGLDEEAQAKEDGRKVAITKVVIGLGLLPDNEQPQNQTALLEPKAETTCFVKAIDTEHGFYRVEADIPIPDKGYNYFEMGTLTDTGVLYSYARSRGDYIAGTADSDGKLTRIRLNFRTDNSELITITQDDSILFTPITDFEAHVVEFNAHCQADNPHPQYVLDAHAATNDDIDNVSTANKFIKLQQLWRALTPIRDRANEALNVAHSKWTYVQASLTAYGATKLSSAINSTSEALSATPLAVKLVADIAKSKITKVQADLWYWKRGETVTNSTRLNNTVNAILPDPNTIPQRDGSGDIQARSFRFKFPDSNQIKGGLVFRHSIHDDITRVCNNIAAIRTWLNVLSKEEGDRRYYNQENLPPSGLVEVNSQAEEDAAFANGALAVIRLDLIAPRSSLYLDFENAPNWVDLSQFRHTIKTGNSPSMLVGQNNPVGKYCAYFPNNHFIYADDSQELRIGDGDWGIEFYLKMTNQTVHTFIVSKGLSGQLNEGWYVAIASGQLVFSGGNNTHDLSIAYPHAADTTNFHHISLNSIGNTTHVYIDGVKFTTFTTPPVRKNAGPLLVGSWFYTAANTNGGYVDLFTMSNKGALRTGNFPPPIEA